MEIVRRADGHSHFQFVLNYTAATVQAPLDRPGEELISGRSCDGSVEVPAGGVAIVRSSPTAEQRLLQVGLEETSGRHHS